ncbi:hypothetical protein [Streptomyces sp. NBC_00827]|uniref:hypothetical protein n=1 Tax=Streptomyces sp. NBC_00827 TaxID=2903677 RepID=UPI00386853AF|nr:hypothetical protein OG569_18305 [Streptomyces sp. NBC_00827]
MSVEAFVLAVEAQQRRDTAKESSWAYYVAYLQAKYDLPVLLLVVCQDRATAKWATGPFACDARDWTAQRTYPLVVGPDNLPVITDERTAAENLTMAAFSADYFNDFLDNSLGKTPAGEKWREILSFVSYFPGRGTVRETAYLEGKAEGEVKGILSVLEVRGIPVPDSVRERITTCTDLDRLDAWLDRSRTVAQAEDLFTEDPDVPESTPDQA